MKLAITFDISDNVVPIEVSDEMTLGDLKAYIEIESGIAAQIQVLVHKNQPLQGDESSLSTWNFEDDDMIMVVSQHEQPSSQTEVDQQQQIETLRLQVLGDVGLRNNLVQQFPQLEGNLEDPRRFRQLFLEMERQRGERESSSRDELRRLQQNPDSEENQARILEIIRQEAIADNLHSALEHNPEVFGHVTMLFVDVVVNGQKVKAFVDSGAQATIMSPECVEKCNLSHLVDNRFAGIARGVGIAKILGRIHSAPLKVGQNFYPCSFTVMEGKSVDLLLGLDMLRRYQASIDLRRNLLVFGDSEVPFLAEADIPKELFDEPEVSASASASASATGAPSLMAPTSTPSVTSTSTSISGISDEAIQTLTGLGFSRQEAINALRQTNGNAELAAALLFG
jgi:DNA damage-inducible protein 1